jgi:hypothetical protein
MGDRMSNRTLFGYPIVVNDAMPVGVIVLGPPLLASPGGIPGSDSFGGVPRKTAQQADFSLYGIEEF